MAKEAATVMRKESTNCASDNFDNQSQNSITMETFILWKSSRITNLHALCPATPGMDYIKIRKGQICQLRQSIHLHIAHCGNHNDYRTLSRLHSSFKNEIILLPWAHLCNLSKM